MDINAISHLVIGSAYKVSNALGCGFLEKVYENALSHEIRKAGLIAMQQYPINVYYDNTVVGEYFADIVVENCLIVELKAVKFLEDIHLAQCLNYLRATGMDLALLVNFYHPKVAIKRVVGSGAWSNVRN